jgi:hypothetical protein
MKSNKEFEEQRRKLKAEIITAYANIPLRGKPNNLHEIYKVFRNESGALFGLKKEVIDYKINEIIKISKMNDFNIDVYMEKIKNFPTDSHLFSDIDLVTGVEYMDAFHKKPTVYGNSVSRSYPIIEDVYKYYIKENTCYVEEDCVDVDEGITCPCDSFRGAAIDNELLKGPDRLKCFECDQEYFIYIINSIISGKSYDEIAGFNVLTKEYHEGMNYDLSVKDKKLYNKRHQINYLYTGDFNFPAIFNGVISYLLVEFLSDPNFNRKRFKRCPRCNQFFIAKDAKRIICYSDNCVKERWCLTKQKQRDEDPFKYGSSAPKDQ